MKIVARFEIILSKQDAQRAEANSGLVVDLEAPTKQLLIRVVRDEEEKAA